MTDRAWKPTRSGGAAGIVLLEVVLAMGLFLLAAAIVAGGLRTSATAVRLAQLEATAADLAVSAMSRVQMGLIPLASDGPNEFEDGPAGWTWSLAVTPLETASLETVQVVLWRLEVVVTGPEGYRHRFVQLMSPGQEALEATAP